MGIKIKRKSSQTAPSEVLISDLIKSMIQHGIQSDDILDIMARAGIPADMGTSLIHRMGEDLEVQGIKPKKTILREEMDSVMWDWVGEIETRNNEGRSVLEEEVKGLKEDMIQTKAAVEKMSHVLVDLKKQGKSEHMEDLHSIKASMEDVNASVGSFDIFAKEILYALKKMDTG